MIFNDTEEIIKIIKKVFNEKEGECDVYDHSDETSHSKYLFRVVFGNSFTYVHVSNNYVASAGYEYINKLNKELKLLKRRLKLDEMKRRELTEYILKNTKSF